MAKSETALRKAARAMIDAVCKCDPPIDPEYWPEEVDDAYGDLIAAVAGSKKENDDE